MAQQQQPFTTVPRGFHYRYDGHPQTPEPELSSAVEPTASPPRGRKFQVRRRRDRTRVYGSMDTESSEIMASINSESNEMIASVNSEPNEMTTGTGINEMIEIRENALPSIEVSEQETVESPEAQQPPMIERLLTPFQQIANDHPQTPAVGHAQRAVTPAPREPFHKTSNQFPSSPHSGISDSEDEECSVIGSEDGHVSGGSVTSVESPPPEPFHASHHDVSKSFSVSSPLPQSYLARKKYWTKEMDNHMWSVYSTYLNDPTVTPFKTLPGCPPPHGVCHQVASEARKTWEGARRFSGQSQTNDNLPWPGAGSATRKRFRKLCRRKAYIIPHYQRMMRSQSPPSRPARISVTQTRSPIALYSPRVRTFGTLPGTSSDWQQAYASNTYSYNTGNLDTSTDPFATRDVFMSLATSTSVTMRPDGPLALMASEAFQDSEQPQASRYALDTLAPDVEDITAAGASINRLGSPFTGSNTWGPNNVQGVEQLYASSPYLSHSVWSAEPSATGFRGLRSRISDRLSSPIQFSSAPFPTRMPKRPATSELGDDEVSNGDTTSRRIRREDVLGASLLDASRRLRMRGMSLGARFAENDHYVSEPCTFSGLQATEEPVLAFASLPPGTVRPVPIEDPFVDPPQLQPMPRLRSPFPGIGTRPSRGRHASSLSLPSVSAPDLSSVDHRVSEDIAE